MKTPDEIKKALKQCIYEISCRGCPYVGADCDDLDADALGYIQQLEAALTDAKSDGMECIVEEEMW